ncbi:MAG TPA: enoyl-CoA hydratase/isomerase family protein [Caulobacteraceae bacterium]|nr:enoyl-CoA hydratase/isomerase family protein [Caulobacteraceae bacterium]
MSYEAILYETRGPVAIITLNRPERLNAIGQAVREEVHQAIEEARADDGVRAAIITGAGKGFCSGADLSGGAARLAAGGAGAPPRPAATNMTDKLDEDGWVGRWAKRFAYFDKPLIGAINGVAAGAGMSMALACDVRIGSTNARFKTVFVERNLSPDSGMSYFLPRIVGYSRAADLVFSSRAVGAEEAHRIGLLDRVVEPEALIDEAVRMGEEMAQWPPLAIRMAKRVLQRNQDAELEDALRYESVALGFARKATADTRESIAAFAEKRKGVYTGA